MALPPPPRRPNPLFHTLTAGTTLFRLFDPSRCGATAGSFLHFGPLLHFDHHGAPAGEPDRDPERGIYYAGLSFSCCVVEVFGDTGLIESGDWRIALPRLTRDLRVLDLRGRGAMRAGSVAALAKMPDHERARAWSRWFYERPEYERPEGLLYVNAHNDEAALALYERAEDALAVAGERVLALTDPLLRPWLLQIAEDHHLVCMP